MKFAVIQTGGKQYKVSPGEKIRVEKLNAKGEGNSPKQSELATGQVIFDKILLVGDDNDVKIGAPYVEGAKVEAKVLRQGRDKKKIVFRYHSKTRYRKKKGHR